MLDCLLVLFSAAVSQKISAVPFSPFQVFFCRCYMSDATLATITISTCLHTQPSSRTFWLVALWTLYFWFLKHVYWRHTLTCVSIMKHLHLIIKLVEFNKYFFCTYCWCLKLARTVYIHRIWPYIWWFPTKNTVFTLYIYGSGQPYWCRIHTIPHPPIISTFNRFIQWIPPVPINPHYNPSPSIQ